MGLLRHAAVTWPDKTAWVFDATDDRLTFADLADRVEALAGSLHALGVRRGDHVAVMLENQPEFPLTWLALARLGAVLVPVNTNYRELDGRHVFAHSGARFIVAGERFTELLTTIAPKTSVERVLTFSELPDGETPPGTNRRRTAHQHPVHLRHHRSAEGMRTARTDTGRHWPAASSRISRTSMPKTRY